jgi:uncharacterized lipoprotein YddW (UPF0748 family)
MNAVIVQVRPAADAFYPSVYEPWSQWLTGKQGRTPFPYYDPLQFMIEETHKRGMEFHAWCNPYRAVYEIARSSVSPGHITHVHPEWFLSYGGTRYFDPGNKEVQRYVLQVIRDIVHRYDIDAIHFDDYFYPYRIAGLDFPDDASYLKYGNGMSREDWRRSNVDSIILALGKMIREEKEYCKFGISPFGVWRNRARDPEGSDTRAGQTNYDDLYADILLWLRNGWIDYVAPQLYWEFGQKAVPFEVLLDWWGRHEYGRQCYIGLGIFRAGSNAAWRDRTQLTRQLQAVRDDPQVQGVVYFSSKSFERNPNGWNDSLQQNYYRYPALVPPMKWIDSIKPTGPIVRKEFDRRNALMSIYLTPGDVGEQIRGFAIYKRDTEDYHIDSARLFAFVPAGAGAKFMLKTGNLPPAAKKSFYFVTAISRTNMESDPLMVYRSSDEE